MMKIKSCLLLLVVCVSYSSCLNLTSTLNAWKDFKKTHGKTYLSEEIDDFRFNIFSKNLELIEEHNHEYESGMHTYKLGVTVFADWTHDEFKSKLLGYNPKINRMRSHELFVSKMEDKDLLDEIDWRAHGLVSDVKNQGECGSCWSFSTTGAVEGAHAKVSGKLVALSEQQLVDCSGEYGNNGCDGGLMDNAFKYIIENGGLTTEENYPYKATQGKCNFKKETAVASIKSFVDIPSKDEKALQEAVSRVGPVSIAIDVTEGKFMLYKEGVFVDTTCSNDEDKLNHGVLVVGYGGDDEKANKGLKSLVKSSDPEFWIVKNSWGPRWGENGYIRMARNKNNMCGIATSASYPTV